MLPLAGRPARLCSGPSRREFLRVGGLPSAVCRCRDSWRADGSASRTRKAKSCLLIFMDGGPSHLELWDLKPDAPAEVRGEFKPIRIERARPHRRRTAAADLAADAPLRPGALGPPRHQRPQRRQLLHAHRPVTRSTARSSSRPTRRRTSRRSARSLAKLRPGRQADPAVRPPARVPVEQRRRHRRAEGRLPRREVRPVRRRRPEPAGLRGARASTCCPKCRSTASARATTCVRRSTARSARSATRGRSARMDVFQQKAVEIITSPETRAGVRPVARAGEAPRALRHRPRQRPQHRGPEVRRAAAPGPDVPARPPADRGRACGW